MRWAGKDGLVVAERFICGEFNKHALARLWWGAELSRNGSDYSLTPAIFMNQDVQNSWVKTRLFRHRPTAIASLRLISNFGGDGKFADTDTIRTLVKAFNIALTTTILDAVAPSQQVDGQAVRDWCKEDVDETRFFETTPAGPAESPAPQEHIEAAMDLLRLVVSKTRFEKRVRTSNVLIEAA